MTDDLVKRLRDMCGKFGVLYSRDIYDTDVAAAADRIELLEAALREIADGVRDADKSYVSLFHELQIEARTALGEKIHD